jgi:uncharacterized protein (DUF885 family)
MDSPPAKAQLDALMAAFAAQDMDRSPELVTSLGLDKDDRAGAEALLDDRSLAAREQDKIDTQGKLARLRAIDRAALHGQDAVNHDTLAFRLENQARFDQRFAYGDGPGAPFVLSQLSGAYRWIPDFLDSQHRIDTRADAQAYLARLEAFGTVLDQETGKARHDAGLGVIPPDFAIDKALAQMSALRAMPMDEAPLIQSLARRARTAGIDGDWAAAAERLYRDAVAPALDRQIALMDGFRAGADHDAGVWRLPEGEAYYAASLEDATTTEMTPAEIHRTGLDLIASQSAELDDLLKAEGLTVGSVGARLNALHGDPAHLYPNTDAGKARLLADLNAQVEVVRAKLPAWFRTLPKAKVEIRRVPPYTEAASAGGYYQQGSLDGRRAAAYYINLRDTAEWPSWSLPTLTYHEAIPGHHLQLSLQQDADLPLIRKVIWFSAYGEGWALYAEQLADEMGMYEADPIGRIGYLQSALFRAVRLVVDSGIHHLRWSREQALKVYVETLGGAPSSAVTEIERYAVWPGQACSYMVGKLTWTRLRDRAKARLGERFDIRDFHDAGLLPGAIPLTVLEMVMADYTDRSLDAAWDGAPTD